MKAVDITLLFQAINFFIAYWILRSYVFYPAMKILNKEKSEEDLLKSSISKLRLENEKAVDHKLTLWSKIKLSLRKSAPKVLRIVDTVDSSASMELNDKVGFSKEEKVRLKQDISEKLVGLKYDD